MTKLIILGNIVAGCDAPLPSIYNIKIDNTYTFTDEELQNIPKSISDKMKEKDRSIHTVYSVDIKSVTNLTNLN